MTRRRRADGRVLERQLELRRRVAGGCPTDGNSLPHGWRCGDATEGESLRGPDRDRRGRKPARRAGHAEGRDGTGRLGEAADARKNIALHAVLGRRPELARRRAQRHPDAVSGAHVHQGVSRQNRRGRERKDGARVLRDRAGRELHARGPIENGDRAGATPTACGARPSWRRGRIDGPRPRPASAT